MLKISGNLQSDFHIINDKVSYFLARMNLITFAEIPMPLLANAGVIPIQPQLGVGRAAGRVRPEEPDVELGDEVVEPVGRRVEKLLLADGGVVARPRPVGVHALGVVQFDLVYPIRL